MVSSIKTKKSNKGILYNIKKFLYIFTLFFLVFTIYAQPLSVEASGILTGDGYGEWVTDSDGDSHVYPDSGEGLGNKIGGAIENGLFFGVEWVFNIIGVLIFAVAAILNWLISGEQGGGIVGDSDLDIRSSNNFTIDGLIFGRLLSGKSAINFGSFELAKGNPYGIIGARVFVFFKGLVYGLIPFVALYMLYKKLLNEDAKSKVSFKELLYDLIIFFLFIYLIPQLADFAVWVRDQLLYSIRTVFHMKGQLGLVNMYANAYKSEPTIVNSILYAAVCLASLTFLKSYATIAIQQTALFGIYPVVGIMGIRDKKLHSQWMAQFFTNIFIPLIDAILFVVPFQIMAVATGLDLNLSTWDAIGNSAKKFLFINEDSSAGLSLIVLFSIGAIVPTRNAILKLLGNSGIIPTRGGVGGIIAGAMAFARRIPNGAGGNGGMGATGMPSPTTGGSTGVPSPAVEQINTKLANNEELLNEAQRNAAMNEVMARDLDADMLNDGDLNYKGLDIDQEVDRMASGMGSDREDMSLGRDFDDSDVGGVREEDTDEAINEMRNSSDRGMDVDDSPVSSTVETTDDISDINDNIAMANMADIDPDGSADVNSVMETWHEHATEEADRIFTQGGYAQGNLEPEMVPMSDYSNLGGEYAGFNDAIIPSNPNEFANMRGENLAQLDSLRESLDAANNNADALSDTLGFDSTTMVSGNGNKAIDEMLNVSDSARSDGHSAVDAYNKLSEDTRNELLDARNNYATAVDNLDGAIVHQLNGLREESGISNPDNFYNKLMSEHGARNVDELIDTMASTNTGSDNIREFASAYSNYDNLRNSNASSEVVADARRAVDNAYSSASMDYITNEHMMSNSPHGQLLGVINDRQDLHRARGNYERAISDSMTSPEDVSSAREAYISASNNYRDSVKAFSENYSQSDIAKAYRDTVQTGREYNSIRTDAISEVRNPRALSNEIAMREQYEQDMSKFAAAHKDGLGEIQYNNKQVFNTAAEYQRKLDKETQLKRLASLKSFDSDRTRGVLSYSEKAEMYGLRATELKQQRNALLAQREAQISYEDAVIRAENTRRAVTTVASVGGAVVGGAFGIAAGAADDNSFNTMMGGAMVGSTIAGSTGGFATDVRRRTLSEGTAVGNARANYNDIVNYQRANGTRPVNDVYGNNYLGRGYNQFNVVRRDDWEPNPRASKAPDSSSILDESRRRMAEDE